MHSHFPKTALALLLSLGVAACSSGGGGSGSSQAHNPEHIKQINQLKAQIKAEQAAAQNAHHLSAASQKAKEQAERDLDTARQQLAQAQQNVADTAKRLEAETAKANSEAQAKQAAQKELDNAKAQLAQAQQNVADTAKRLEAETAKANSEAQAKQAAQKELDNAKAQLAQAQQNVADTAKRLEAETAKANSEAQAKQAAQKELDNAKAQLAQAEKELAKAKQDFADFQKALAEEEARKQAQIKAEQEERERLEAEWRKQEEERQKAWEEEQARLEAERQTEEAKRKAEEEKIAIGNYNSEEKLWRFQTFPNYLFEHYPEKVHNGRYASQDSLYFEDTTKGSLNTYAKFHEFPVADKIETLPLTAVKTNTRFENGEEVVEKISSEIGKIAFTNQQYASYWITKSLIDTEESPYNNSSDYHVNWILDKAGYVALPTVASQSDVIKNGTTATYTGKIIEGNYDKTVTTRPNPNSSGDYDALLYKTTYVPTFTSGDFSLTANFGQGTVEGMITNRQSGGSDIQLHQTNIKLDSLDGDNKMVKFEGIAKDVGDSNPNSLGNRYEGVFAGPNAEEVVGTVPHNFSTISFGGKR